MSDTISSNPVENVTSQAGGSWGSRSGTACPPTAGGLWGDKVPPPNELILEILDQLAQYVARQLKLEGQQHLFRLIQIRNARRAIAALDYPLKSGLHAKSVKGIGPRIATRIDEILRTGTLRELSQPITADPDIEAAAHLAEVNGIGEVTAVELMQRGIRTVEALQQAVENGSYKPTRQIRLGLEYHSQIIQPIPRAKADDIISCVSAKIKERFPELTTAACGSFRRGKSEVGDIDILISSPSLTTRDQVDKSRLLTLIIAGLRASGIELVDLTSSNTNKYMGIITSDRVARRIDLRLIPSSSWAFGLLGFTGSREFNMKMRAVANTKSLKLNDYELVHRVNGETFPASSEQDIFDYLDMAYVGPEYR